MAFLSVENEIPSVVTIFCWTEKIEACKKSLLIIKESYNGSKLNYRRRENVNISPLFKLDSCITVESDYCSLLISRTEVFCWIFVVALKEMNGTLLEHNNC